MIRAAVFGMLIACQRGEFLASGDATPTNPPPQHIRVVGTVTATDGPLEGHTAVVLRVGNREVTNTFLSANGAYVIEADVPSGTTRATVEKQFESGQSGAHAPTVGELRIDPAITEYRLDLQLVPVTVTELSTSSTTDVPFMVLGQQGLVRFPISPRAGVFAVSTVIPVANAPGAMRPAGQTGRGLQSAGMFYLDAFDSSFNRVSIAGTRITLGGGMPAEIPDADPFNSWRLNDTGDWDMKGSLPLGAATAGPTEFDAGEFGFWNADRAYRTACLRGKLETEGQVCPGAAVKAVGPDEIASRDTSQASGNFCIEGAQTRSSTLSVGTATLSVTMPANAGDCSIPETCGDLGTISVPADACGKIEPICEFRCSNGNCIEASSVCNGQFECPAGDDENPTICNNPTSCCEATMGCPGETGSDCAATCCCCPGGQACCANGADGCCASP
jgi:hypothetical protein